jgi:hypothetical protein
MLGDKCFIVKERSIWELVYVGGTDVFIAELRVDGAGSFSPQAIINLGEELALYGSDNVYLYDGIDLTPIGKQIYALLYETVNRIVNGAMANRVASAYIEELKQFVMVLPPAEGTIPNIYFTYDFDYEAWSRRTKEVTAIGFYSVPSGIIWSDLSGDWTTQDWIWLEKVLAAGAPTTLIGDTTGYIFEDDRITTSTDYMCYETKDFLFEHTTRWIEFRVLAKGGPFKVYYSIDSGATWSTPRDYAVVSDYTEFVLPLNVTSQKIRFKLECVVGAATEMDIKWIEPWYIPRKRTKSLASA